VIALALLSLAQETVSIDEAVARALKNYAAVEVSEQQVRAAAAGISLARTAYLPRADFYSQFNRGSRNNIFGILLPQSTLPSISGPPSPQNDMTSVWGSAVGFLVSWEPFDFGLRAANVGVAEAGKLRAEAAQKRTEYEIAAMTADAYVTLLAAEEMTAAATASVERATAIERVIEALTKAELRPGADLSRARAERSVAEMQAIQAEQAIATARASLAQFAGPVAQTKKLAAPPNALEAGGAHPALAEQSAAIDETKAREKALEKAYAPKIAVQGSLYARGTGANPDGTTLGGANGLGPNIANYVVGLTITFPAMSKPAIQAEQSQRAAEERAHAARLKQLKQDLAAQLESAKARLDGARKIAAQIPAQRAAAQAALDQSTARYKAGLGTIAEVAESQRLVAQIATDESLARVAIWRALLHVATAQGDLRPFLAATDPEAAK
jgi:outer membrane protein TolC